MLGRYNGQGLGSSIEALTKQMVVTQGSVVNLFGLAESLRFLVVTTISFFFFWQHLPTVCILFLFFGISVCILQHRWCSAA